MDTDIERRFEAVNNAYSSRRRRLLVEGRFQRQTSHGYWAQTNPEHVFELFKKINLGQSRSFLDLGSGDGIVTSVASLFTKATGIEIDPKLHQDAEDLKAKLGLTSTNKNMDYLAEDLADYDVIFIAPDNYFHKLEKNIVEQFKGTLIILDNIFRPLTLTADETISVRGTNFNIYRIS